MTQLVKDANVNLALDFVKVRNATLELFRPLSIEDAVMQSDIFGSPPNWHLAHVTWFFHKVLEKHGEKLAVEQDGINLNYLNSYYQRYGDILPKSERGKFPRPTVKQTLAYRTIIDNAVVSFLEKRPVPKDAAYDSVLGMQHDMQHQELMIYDFQHYFSRFADPEDNYKPATMRNAESLFSTRPAGMVNIPGGIYELGLNRDVFCYDNELPVHKVYMQPYRIDVAPVTNGDYIKFIESGGYEDYKYWLADGWDLVRENGWNAPLYWEKKDSAWYKKDFHGVNEIDPEKPVVNVSYYEADAYARWAGKRLPTEAEWEKAASWNEGLGRKTLYPWGDEEPTPSRANLL